MNAIDRGFRGVGLDLCLERIHAADQLFLLFGQMVALIERGDERGADLYCIDFVDPVAMDHYPLMQGGVRSTHAPDEDGSWVISATPEGPILTFQYSATDARRPA